MGLSYSLSDFSFTGGFANWWNEAFTRVKEKRPSYGTKPNQAVVELEYYRKIMSCTTPFVPYENYDDLLHLLMFRTSVEYCKRAGKEVSLFTHVFFMCLLSNFRYSFVYCIFINYIDHRHEKS